uniref:Holin n=1 Tax=viral metagenome TaxID=1070528 RepID=A0A6C0JYC7_9ZZZZ
MFNKIRAVISLPEVFQQGKMLTDAAAWKRGNIAVSMVTGFLASIVAIAKLFGYELPLTDDQIVTIGGAIFAVTGMFLHPTLEVATTEKLGVAPKKRSNN